MIGSEHNAVVHADEVRGKIRAAQLKSGKLNSLLGQPERLDHGPRLDAVLSSSARMLLLCSLKDGALIAAVIHPHGEDDPDPHVRQRPNSYRVALALRSFTLIVVSSPCLTLGALPGELVQSIAQGFDAPQAAMRFGIHPALKQHRRGSTQRLQTAGVAVAASIITDFGQQSRSQTLACTRQARKNLMVLMGQKKGVNLPVVLSDLLEQWQQLIHQHQHQTRFGACGHRISLQMGLMHLLENLSCNKLGIGMLGLSKNLLELCLGSGHRRLWGGIALQEPQGTLLLQFGKQIQSHRIIGFEAGRELIDQARLHVDQGVLIAREHFELCNLLAIWDEAMQVGKVADQPCED